jgi:5-methylthioadenosine/S-adenosylhomocysteine deaminase
MNIRFYNARVYTMEPGREIFHGEVWIKDDRIAQVAEDTLLQKLYAEHFLPNLHWDLEIDCGNDLLMPGLKNGHTHSPMTFLRSLADDKPLQDWLNEDVFPNEEKLTPDDIYDFARLAILEYLSGGTTSIFDMYINPPVVAQACMDSGFRCVLTSGLNDFTSSQEQTLREFETLNHINPLIGYRLGFHAEYTTSAEKLKALAEAAKAMKAPVFTHLSETKKEVEQCIETTGMSPVAYLDSIGMFDYGGGGYHCVHVDEDDIRILKERGVSVITNPASNCKLASGIAPIKAFLDAGINVGIGTDGAASNNCLDMWREIYLTAVLAKLREEDAACIPADRILSMAVAGNAKAMGLESADCLSQGKLADLILVDLKAPNMLPEHHIPKNLVYSGSRENVRLTMIGGRILYKDGEYFIGESADSIIQKCEVRAKRIFASL